MQHLVLKHLLTIRAQGGRINSTLQKPGISAYNLVTEGEPQAVIITILSRGPTRSKGNVYFNRIMKKYKLFMKYILHTPSTGTQLPTDTYIHTYVTSSFAKDAKSIRRPRALPLPCVHFTRGAPVPLPAKFLLIFCSRISALA